MVGLIPAPDLDLRNEELLAAEMIARVSGGASAVLLRSKIAVLEEQIKLVEAGGLPAPACAELTNADPAATHTVLLETMGWHLGQFARRINFLPVKNQIAFLNLLGITQRVATPATTMLEFTVTPQIGVGVTIPAGTHVSSQDGTFVFTTDAQLVVSVGLTTGTTAATCTADGHTLLSPDVLIQMVDVVSFVTAVTNQSAIDSGSAAETIESALERARRYLRRGERLVTSKDIEDAILDEALLGNGIVRAFPFIIGGDFTTHEVGHTSVIVATRSGDPIGDQERKRINQLLLQLIGNQWAYVLDPVTVDFNVSASVRLATSAPQGATLAAIETNLRAFYSGVQENFGRPISRSEIIAVIEGTSGVDRIVSAPGAPILASPLVDVRLQFYEIPRLGLITIVVA